MNRIQNPTRPGQDKSGTLNLTSTLHSDLFAPPRPDTSRVMFTPIHYERHYSYPLIIWLHGPGNTDERQLLRIMPIISLRNYVAVAPRGFRKEERAPGSGIFDWPQTPEHIQETQSRVWDCIEAARRRWHVASDRVYLAGFGAGGTMAIRVAMRQPHRFAGVASLCGPLPSGYRPLVQLLDARRLPVLLAVGRDSTEYSPARACDDLRLLHTAGISVSLRQYPCGQQLAYQMLRDVDRWIMEHITSRAECPVS